MKIVVIGGSGLIGTKLVKKLRKKGHEALAASPSSGVNTITGEGLAASLAGAQVVVDLANSPSWEDKAVLEFFQTSGRNLLAAEAAAGVRHHVALSIVGTDRTPDNGYFRAKVAQEKLIESSGIPYTIIRSTQFMEFLSGIVEIAGPERAPFNEIVARYLKAVGDSREVVRDPEARYFGGRVEERSLVPLGEARLGRIGLDDWLRRSQAKARSCICEGNESALSYVIDRIGPQGRVFASDFPHEIAMEDALHEIDEILERKDINDKHKAMILGENVKRFYNL